MKYLEAANTIMSPEAVDIYANREITLILESLILIGTDMKYIWKLVAVIANVSGLASCSKDKTTDKSGGCEAVDLGLSVKWATMNIGATKPEEFGDYFAWGETAAKETYSWANYKWVQDSPVDFEGYGISKYSFHDGIKDGIWYSGDTFVGDNKMEFSDYDYADDAARKNWKGNWKTPSFNDWIELGNRECMDWTWTDDYKGTGVAGEIVTSKIAGYEGNSIFFPAAGYKYDSYHDRAGSACLYWSSSLMNYSHCGWLVFFLPDGTVDEDEFHRYQGLPVRPVIK